MVDRCSSRPCRCARPSPWPAPPPGGVGAALPGGGGRAPRLVGGPLVVVSGLVALLYVLFRSAGMALEEDPALAIVPAGVLVLLMFLAIELTSRRGRPPTPEQTRRKDDDGGGQGRPRPSPRPRTPPPAPAGPDPGPHGVPWDQFGDLRTQWERVPAGTR